MRPDKHITSNEGKPRKRRMSLELYYWERVGNRFYFRYNRFALILMIIGGLTLSIFDPGGQSKIEPNITVPSPSPSAWNYPVIRQASPQSTSRVDKQSKSSLPALPSPSTPDKNGNEQLVPQFTPPAQPSKPPP